MVKWLEEQSFGKKSPTMGSVFKHIYADFAYEFQKDFESFAEDEHSLLQRICDVTGVVLITCDNAPQKLFGPWNSVKSAHDLLSGFLLFRTLQKTIQHEKSKKAEQSGGHENANNYSTRIERVASSSPGKCSQNKSKSENVVCINLDSDENEQIKTPNDRTSESRKNHDNECMDVEKMSEMYQQIPQVTVKNQHTGNTAEESKELRTENDMINDKSENDASIDISENDTLSITSENDMSNIRSYFDEYGNEIYQCDMCSYIGNKKRNLFIHRIRTHLRPLKCGRCFRGFGLHKDLVRHYKNKRNCLNYGVHYKGTRKCRRFQHSRETSPFVAATRGEFDQTQHDVSSFNNKVDEHASKSKEESPVQENESSDYSYPKSNEAGQDNNSNYASEDSSSMMQLYRRGASKKWHRRRFHHYGYLDDHENALMKIKQEIPDDYEVTASTGAEEMLINSGKQPSEVDQKQEPSSDPVRTVVEAFPNLMRMLHVPGNDEPTASLSEAYQTENSHRSSVSPKSVRRSPEEGHVTFPCDYCSFTSPRRQQLEDHIKRIHCKQFECAICGSMFGMIKDLNRHYRRTHKMQIDYQRRGRRAQEEPLKISPSKQDQNKPT